jgi:uncharacterized membrane protein YphA (DoxX/SURF4 family)
MPLALLFVISGFGKIPGFQGTVEHIASKGLPPAGSQRSQCCASSAAESHCPREDALRAAAMILFLIVITIFHISGPPRIRWSVSRPFHEERVHLAVF